MMNYVEEQN